MVTATGCLSQTVMRSLLRNHAEGKVNGVAARHLKHPFVKNSKEKPERKQKSVGLESGASMTMTIRAVDAPNTSIIVPLSYVQKLDFSRSCADMSWESRYAMLLSKNVIGSRTMLGSKPGNPS